MKKAKLGHAIAEEALAKVDTAKLAEQEAMSLEAAARKTEALVRKAKANTDALSHQRAVICRLHKYSQEMASNCTHRANS